MGACRTEVVSGALKPEGPDVGVEPEGHPQLTNRLDHAACHNGRVNIVCTDWAALEAQRNPRPAYGSAFVTLGNVREQAPPEEPLVLGWVYED